MWLNHIDPGVILTVQIEKIETHRIDGIKPQKSKIFFKI